MDLPRILYVDDDDLDRMVLERFSRSLAFHIDTCDSVASAKSLLNNGYCGFIIDWNLCDGSGEEIAAEIPVAPGEILPPPFIIFISGIFSSHQIDEAKVYSPLACIEKGRHPDYPHNILALVETHLDSQK